MTAAAMGLEHTSRCSVMSGRTLRYGSGPPVPLFDEVGDPVVKRALARRKVDGDGVHAPGGKLDGAAAPGGCGSALARAAARSSSVSFGRALVLRRRPA